MNFIHIFYPNHQTTPSLTPFQNKHLFLHVCRTSLSKTMWEKKKLLVKSKFLSFQQCFLPIWRTFCHFHQIENCSLQISFDLDKYKICHEEVTLSQTTNFSLLLTERVCTRQFFINKNS